MPRRAQVRDAQRALEAAPDYAAWQRAALDLDAVLGLDAWRADDDSPHYDAPGLQRQIEAMGRLRDRNEPHALFALLHDGLHRHLNDLTEPELYGTAWSGTKHLVTRYLDEVVRSIAWLAETEHPEAPAALRRDRFARVSHVFGRSALMLSGGATLGFHHLGVVKALFEQDLLPQVITGASMGAMIAAGICARTDDELRELFADPDRVARDGLALEPARRMVRERHLLVPERLHDTILHNCGDHTFAEAHARSGRILNISVSPTRHRQKPRVLCHLTSPDVLVSRAALASSAVPGLFPPVELQRRDHDGVVRPYIAGERWIDGSMRGDLPTLRVGRLHNVNHFVVSQTNPHVLPFVRQGRRGYAGWAADLVIKAAHRQGVNVVGLARELGHRTPLGPALEIAESLAAQTYRGDIDIFPAVPLVDFRKVLTNPSREDLVRFIRNGERGAWPRLAMIRDQTRIGVALARSLAALGGRT